MTPLLRHGKHYFTLIKHITLRFHELLDCRDSIELILSNGLTLGVLVAIFLHLVLPYHEDDDSLTVVIDGDAKPAKHVDVSASDMESVDEKVCAMLDPPFAVLPLRPLVATARGRVTQHA